MHPEAQEELIKVLNEIADELKHISTNTSNINIELEKLNSQDFSGPDISTSDIAKNIADVGLLINNKLEGIGYCLDDGKDHGLFEERKGGKR